MRPVQIVHRANRQNEKLNSSSLSRGVDIPARHPEVPLITAHGTTAISNSDKSPKHSSRADQQCERRQAYASPAQREDHKPQPGILRPTHCVELPSPSAHYPQESPPVTASHTATPTSPVRRDEHPNPSAPRGARTPRFRAQIGENSTHPPPPYPCECPLFAARYLGKPLRMSHLQALPIIQTAVKTVRLWPFSSEYGRFRAKNTAFPY